MYSRLPDTPPQRHLLPNPRNQHIVHRVLSVQKRGDYFLVGGRNGDPPVLPAPPVPHHRDQKRFPGPIKKKVSVPKSRMGNRRGGTW